MSNIFKTILLFALPASGKSEVRNFMANIDPERLRNDFHIGANLQLDDFPYVHFMRLVDNALEDRGEPRLFYESDETPFFDNRDWGTLVMLVNEDYDNMKAQRFLNTDSYALDLFSRLDQAGAKVGFEPRIAALDDELIEELAEVLEDDAKAIVDFLESQYTDEFDDRTVIIECARGGPDGSEMPLTGGYGYQYTIPLLSKEILDDAALLYIWVTPEESRRKNNERANPDDPGSNLFHGVPMPVMLGDYGCDDMEYLRNQSDVPDTLVIENKEGTWHLPIGVFDNRVDKTSFLREDKEKWSEDAIADMTTAIQNATDTMWKNYKK